MPAAPPMAMLQIFAGASASNPLLKALATGKKPAPVAVFSKFQTFRSGNLWSGNTRAAPQTDVVDVEVRELGKLGEVDETLPKKHLPQD